MKIEILDSATKELKVPAVRSEHIGFINETYNNYVEGMKKEKPDLDRLSETKVDDHIVSVFNNGVEIHVYPKG